MKTILTAARTPDEYVACHDGWRRGRVEALRRVVRAAAPELDERLKWGHLVYFASAPVLLIRAEPERVLFGFWRGQRLRDIEPRLKAGGKYEMATLALAADTPLAEDTVARLVAQAVRLHAADGDATAAAGSRPPAPPVVRPATDADVAAVRDCVVAAFSGYIARIGRTPAPMGLDFAAQVRDGHVWVAEADGAIAGTIVQYETPQGFYVDTVAAAPRLQRRGVGRALLVFAEHEAARRGHESLYLCTNSLMVENQALYQKIGYVEVERKAVAGYDRVFYRKALAAAATVGVVQLVRPALEHLPRYVAALERGWSPNTTRAAAAREELEQIDADPQRFVDGLEDREGRGPPVPLPDGSTVPRLPGFRRWMWHDDFVGSIGLRWQPGTVELPPHCLGHIGYAVVPWAQRRGYAKAALKLMLAEAAGLGLPFVEITTDPDNVASQRVIEGAGGTLHERFVKPASFGGGTGLRYRVGLPPG